MFSAYTIKKVLPRLLIAAILIQLSWWLCIEAIKLTNVVAAGIEGIIYAPFGGADKFLDLNNILVSGGGASAAGAAVGGAAIAGLVASFFATGGGSLIGVLALAGTALLGALIALFLLVIRKIVIMFLVLTVPIAIAAWILPGTQKLWKLWWESFFKLLMVYPMIMGLIAVGKVAAYVVSISGANGFLGFFIIIVCYFGPFFLIPALLKLSGTAFATITGAVNNRGKGAFDRLRNVRENEAKKNKARFMDGERFNNDKLNALSTRMGTKRFGFGRVGKSAYQQKMELASLRHAQSDAGKAGQHNDGMLRAQTYTNEEEARKGLKDEWGMKGEEIERAIAAARANGGWGRNRQTYAAKQLSVTGTGYENIDQVVATIKRVSHGNEDEISSLAGFINSDTKGRGRFELAPGYGKLNNMAREAAGLAPTPSSPAKPRTILSESSLSATIAASRGADPTTLLRGKPQEVSNFADAMHQHIRERDAAGDTVEAERTRKQLLQLESYANAGYASDENAEHIRKLTTELRSSGHLPEPIAPPIRGGAGDPDLTPPPATPPADAGS